MTDLHGLKNFSERYPHRDNRAPVIFIGHGSPMNGIESNEFSNQWKHIGQRIETPAAVLCISAHWYTRGTYVTAMERPETIHDFYGFPKELYDVSYMAPGDPIMAHAVAKMVSSTNVIQTHEWGLDHGCWSIVRQMYPEANIPVLQLSIDGTQLPHWHYQLGAELSALRERGILILGSGNIVHNLGILNWQNPSSAYEWAVQMNEEVKISMERGDHGRLIRYHELGNHAQLSIPTPEHYLPLLYALSAQEKPDPIEFFNDQIVMGSVAMTSLIIGN